jgi:predicted nucleic acid-binding protein
VSLHVLDTSILIDVLRGSQPAADWMTSLDEVPVCSEITRTEILRGVRSAERSPTERLLGAVRWLAVDERVSRRAGDLGRKHRRSHTGLATADLLIAATAVELDAKLATANTKHFPMFSRLRAPYG